MVLKTEDIAKMMDLSCVRMYNTRDDIINLVKTAKEYRYGQVSILQCFIPMVKELLLDDPDIHVVGNVCFPSGSDITEMKVIQAKQMVEMKCDEVDMVMNVNWLKSGMYNEVEEDVAAVRKAVGDIPMKVIIESPLLEKKEIEKACEICVRVKAAFVKTGTGWTESTTVDQVKLIKTVVGDAIRIKASGGVKNLHLLAKMYQAGATRFGVNLNTGISLLKACIAKGGSITV